MDLQNVGEAIARGQVLSDRAVGMDKQDKGIQDTREGSSQWDSTSGTDYPIGGMVDNVVEDGSQSCMLERVVMPFTE